MGIEQDEFVRAFVIALGEDRVIKKLQSAICGQLMKEVGELRKELKDRDKKISVLESEIDVLKNNVDNLEQYSRRLNLRMSGIPEQQHEDVVKVVMDVINTKVCSSDPVKVEDLDRVHRVGMRRTDGTARPILVRFATYRTRQKVFKNRSLLNPKYGQRTPGDPWKRKSESSVNAAETTGSDTTGGRATEREGAVGGSQTTEREGAIGGSQPTETEGAVGGGQPSSNSASGQTPQMAKQQVYINEDLTKIKSNILWKARQAKKRKLINDCWTIDGNIIVRDKSNTIKNINALSDLDSIIGGS